LWQVLPSLLAAGVPSDRSDCAAFTPRIAKG